MDPGDVLINDNVFWAKRREVKFDGKVESKRGSEVPNKLLIPCIGYRRVAVHKEPPILYFKC